MRKFLHVAWFLFVAALATAASAPSIKVTVDCPFCGLGQPFPHDCPRAGEFPSDPAASDPLPVLLETARDHHRRLASIAGLPLAPLGQPRSLRELDARLTDLLATTRTTLAKMEREQAVAQTEAQRLAARVADLRAQIARAADEIAAAEREIPEQEANAVAARDQFLVAQKSGGLLREQIRQARNRLFPRLQLAAKHGWVLPPSSYREVPAPLPFLPWAFPSDLRIVPIPPPIATLGKLGGAVGLEASRANGPPSGTASLDSLELEQTVRTKLNEFAALYYRAYAVFAVRADAGPAAADAQTAALAQLESDLAPLAARRTERQRALAAARRLAAAERARVVEARQLSAHAWIETAIYRFLDRRAAAVLNELTTSAPDAVPLAVLREWAAAAAQLGSDPAGVIARLPSTLAARPELLAEVQREVAALRTELGLTIEFSAIDFPSWLRAYLSEASP